MESTRDNPILGTDREYNFEEAVGVKNDFINPGLDPHYGGGANSHTSHTSADEVCEKCAGTWPRELGTFRGSTTPMHTSHTLPLLCFKMLTGRERVCENEKTFFLPWGGGAFRLSKCAKCASREVPKIARARWGHEA